MATDKNHPEYQTFPINYQRIARAISHYQRWGFEYIEVPWFVPSGYCWVTKPQEVKGDKTFFLKGFNRNMELVGSAEQAFLYLFAEGKIEIEKKYVACTPCFRNEDSSPLNMPNFLKIELFAASREKLTDKSYFFTDVVDTARVFFSQESKGKSKTDYEVGDFFLKDVEIGSFGIREFLGTNYVFCTGLAEPRFSQAEKKITIFRPSDVPERREPTPEEREEATNNFHRAMEASAKLRAYIETREGKLFN